jgi:hypothetical protein
VFSPSLSKYTNYDDYNTQGLIVQDFRNIAKNYKIPVISATQNKRESEILTKALSNEQVGDSYKKIRYGDFVYMCRKHDPQKGGLTIFSDEVSRFVLTDKHKSNGALDPSILKIKDELEKYLKPFEVTITKSKESAKGQRTFMLFCDQTLTIYNNLEEYLIDSPIIKNNTESLKKDFERISNMSFAEVSDMFGDTVDVDSFLNDL